MQIVDVHSLGLSASADVRRSGVDEVHVSVPKLTGRDVTLKSGIDSNILAMSSR